MKFDIVPLRTIKFVIPTLCEWHIDGWGAEYNISTTEQAKEWLIAGATSKKIPICFVAMNQDNPVGMISLEAEDGLNTNETPWLCSLYVPEKYRKNGIGEQLVKHVITHAQKMCFQKLYLLTFNEMTVAWYIRLGWKISRMDKLNNVRCTVMTIDL